MENLKEDLKNKNLSESSINLYLSNLRRLNDNKEFKNLNFLKKYNDIIDKIKDYKDTTKRGYLISIVSVLKSQGEPFNKLYKKYYKTMLDVNKIINDIPPNTKTETQTKNWITWDEVMEVYNKLKSIKFKKGKWDEEMRDTYLDYLILSLYVLLPPRRNKDYLQMVVAVKPKLIDLEDKKFNWFDVQNKQFIFNNHKTSKLQKEPLKVDIPDELMNILKVWIDHNPDKKNWTGCLFGNNNTKINFITRRLNKLFYKKISSSMLRHIYLSSKYKDVLAEQEKDSKLMSHNMDTQKDYIKN